MQYRVASEIAITRTLSVLSILASIIVILKYEIVNEFDPYYLSNKWGGDLS